ncbi:hypothetical protein KHA92_25980, partial [Klebsiella pneumoniae]
TVTGALPIDSLSVKQMRISICIKNNYIFIKYNKNNKIKQQYHSCDLPPVCLCSPKATPYQPEPPKLIIPANHFHPNPALFCLSQTRYTGAVAACRYQLKQESHNDPRTQTLFFHYHPG